MDVVYGWPLIQIGRKHTLWRSILSDWYISSIFNWFSPEVLPLLSLKLVLYWNWIPIPEPIPNQIKHFYSLFSGPSLERGPHPGIFNWFSPEVLPLLSETDAVWALNPNPWTNSQSDKTLLQFILRAHVREGAPTRYIQLILTWSSPSALWNWCCMGIKSRSLNRFLVWFPIDGGNSGCAFELEVAVCKMRVLHLFEKRKKGG